MDDQELDKVLHDAERTYHRPPAAPLDTMWDAVAEQAFAPAAVSRQPWFRMIGIAAAALIVGVLAGRMSVGGSRALLPVPVATAPTVDPASRATERFLDQTAVLLAALPSDRDTAKVDPTLAADGARLLGTTRVLLDSPVADNARIRNLLLDLELVLAQVARLQHQRAHDELIVIQSALNERDIMPRMQSAVNDLSAGTH
jgi:hypothetical protein